MWANEIITYFNAFRKDKLIAHEIMSDFREIQYIALDAHIFWEYETGI
jgi:hypothetical protein